jgi:hypothetical protein
MKIRKRLRGFATPSFIHSVEELQAREDRLVLAITRKAGYDLRYAMHGRVIAKAWLSNNQELFGRYRRLFLMLDSFPENEPRFPLTYRDCVDAAA